MDITESLAANSSQQNYDEFLAGPKTVTVSEVKKGTAEQPVEEIGRASCRERV